MQTPAPIDKPHISDDVNAAHARLRAHQSSIDYIHSRVEGNERRLDRLEKRMDDQSAVLSELSATTGATQREVHAHSAMLERVVERSDHIVHRLDEHTREEIDAQKDQTHQLAHLHRTIIRALTVLSVIAILLIVLTREHQPAWLAALTKVIAG